MSRHSVTHPELYGPDPADRLAAVPPVIPTTEAQLRAIAARVEAFLRSPDGSALFSNASHNFALELRSDIAYALDTLTVKPHEHVWVWSRFYTEGHCACGEVARADELVVRP